MAKDKERTINPAQQQRKLEKAKALKKGKAELQTRRNERLAKRNPLRIQRQIDDLKALEAAGDIKPREKAILADLERDLRAIHKAKEALGQRLPDDKSRPQHAPSRDNLPSSLGKRGRDGQPRSSHRRQSSGSDTDESIRNIPWPRDTPPPVPGEFRKSRHGMNTPQVAPVPVKTTYESAPQIRDLKKEAVSKFVPNVVKQKQQAMQGGYGQLLEPEELDRLEREGYGARAGQIDTNVSTEKDTAPTFSAYKPNATQDLNRLRAEEEAFEKELAIQDADPAEETARVEPSNREVPSSTTIPTQLRKSRHVEMEEVEDEGM